MSDLKIGAFWPPLDSPVEFCPPGSNTRYRATFELFRPSGHFRIYTLRTSDGIALSAIADLDPDSGEVLLVISGLGDPFTILMEAARA